MSAVYGLYPDAGAAQRAVDALRTAGIARSAITVISAEPFEDQEFGQPDRATWMPKLAGVGGAIGLAAGYWLTRLTQTSWPIPTGGMPIVSTWANMIVMFELTMLGAILTTVVTLLVTAKLPRRLPRFYDPDVADGEILVGVEKPPSGSVDRVERALEAGGAGRVKRIVQTS
jgi:hypothetical protein